MNKEGRGLVRRLLQKNISRVQLAGFVLSNFIGLAIVITGIQFYVDVKSIWDREDSFIKQDYIVVNKRVTSSNTLGKASTEFTASEEADIALQPWVRRVGSFTSADYNVYATMDQGGRSMSTGMFLESLPDDYIDVDAAAWGYTPGSHVVPMIISKDYLTLYNFGFASSTGLPQLTENMLGSLPIGLILGSREGDTTVRMQGRIVGFSNRLNTILVPQEFMDWSNTTLGGGNIERPSRLIIDVNSPGDVAIGEYMEAHDMELAGDKKGSEAAYFLNIISGLIIGIGGVITVLSFFILLLSIALLMQKNREKLHLLIMQGIDLNTIGAPYRELTTAVSIISLVMAVLAMFIFRNVYIRGVEGLSGESVGVWLSLSCGVGLTLLTLVINIISIRRRVKGAF